MKPTFSLAELAHFDRCIFPNNLAKSLTEAGLGAMEANDVARYLIDHQNKPGVVEIYQTFRKFPDIIAALEKVLTDFVKKYPNR